MALIGEVGLSGELRAVSQLENRLREAAKLGFRRVLVPKRVRKDEGTPKELELLPVRSVREAFVTIFEES